MPAPRSAGLTMGEALKRLKALGEDKEYLSTAELRQVTGNPHEVTIYRWVAGGLIKAYRTKRGRANSYKREDVEKFIRTRFMLQEVGDHGVGNQAATAPDPATPRKATRKKGQ